MSELKTQQLYSIYKKVLHIALILTLYALVNPTFATSKWQNHQELNKIVYDYVSKNIGEQNNDYKLTISPIDTRLKLFRCEQPLEAFSPITNNLSGRSSIGVRCNGAKPWKVYIPVQITHFRNIIVAKRPLLKGQIVGSDSITHARVELSGAKQAYFYEYKHVLGKILTRAIRSGTPIKAQNLRAANLVKRGQEVILIAITSSIQVKMSGRALTDGAKGDLIRVRNVRSNKIVEGIVTKVGTVKVIM